MTRQTYLRLIGAMIVVAAVTSIFLLQFQWFGDAASTQRGPIDTLFDVMIVLFGAGYSWVVLDDIEAKSSDSMRLDVTAQQFEWSFGYPEKMIGTGASATEVTTHVLHVPVDRQLDVHLTALDVLHSFWVPEWGIKRDAVPARDPAAEGVDNTFVVTPDEEGTYSLICTELCGTGHSTMRATVVVESQDEFDQWLNEQAASQTQPAASGSETSAG